MRDWGHAKEYCELMWLMLQKEKPDDYVVATGRQLSVRSFIEMTARELKWNKNDSKNAIIWEGEGINEIGRRSDNGQVVIRIDERYYRPSEVDNLLGNPEKIKKNLGWEPKITIEEIVKEMVANDLIEIRKEKFLNNNYIDQKDHKH